MSETGKRITEICNERGISPEELAQMSGVALSTIKRIVSEEAKNPRIGTVQKICEGLKISLADFFRE
ncbi:MAG: helix-turn-helix transcriptional regulator [Lachnospiraceae bacterium]|nr:helix-turn-helix transcriptional regulator [Lachnospiraceae bacterium]